MVKAKYTGMHALRHFHASWCINRKADGGLELPAKVAGFEVFEAGDGHEAVAQCAENDLDLLFTDIQLPGEIDGWEIAKRCRQSLPMLPVVYATAVAQDESRAVPGSVLFRKPDTPDQLVGIVQTFTRQG
jgi:CheY-like chemotaxis protein